MYMKSLTFVKLFVFEFGTPSDHCSQILKISIFYPLDANHFDFKKVSLYSMQVFVILIFTGMVLSQHWNQA